MKAASLPAMTPRPLRLERWWLRMRSAGASLGGVALLLIVAYGALLRFEAFHLTYGPLAGSDAFVSGQNLVASTAEELRPASIEWPRAPLPYRMDPKSYLDSARAMKRFYEARLREPLFVLATKVGLWLTGGQDVAVSVASSTFGAVLVVATHALGRAIGGVAVGLASALLIAIEPQMIGSGVRGYRDDLFSLLVVMFAWACIGLSRRSSLRAVLLVALTGAGACLTRITALSFVVPSLAALVVLKGRRDWRDVARPAAVAGLLALALTAPFLVNCWRTFGDPFYSINWHSAFYGRRSNVDMDGALDTGRFLRRRFAEAPIQTTDSILRGLTHYPWANKWAGLGRHWSARLATALKVLCLAGLLMWLWSSTGRIALVVLACSLVPFAVTWEAFADWRFTQHAYPFYMVAGVYAVARPAQWLAALAQRDQPVLDQLRRGAVSLATASVVVAGFFVGMAALPACAAYRELASGRPASVGGDPRYLFFMEHEAFFFFGGGWSAPRSEGNVTFHEATSGHGRLRVPMRGGQGYRCMLRLDPTAPRGVLPIELKVNDWAERLLPAQADEEVDLYWVTIPKGAIRTGLNRIEIAAHGGAGTSGMLAAAAAPGATTPAFKFWYIRCIPQATS